MCSRMIFFAACLMMVAVVKGQICGWNEEYVECTNPCNTCAQRASCITECVEGCDCLPGYFKNWYGFCIPERFCGPAISEIEIDVQDGGGCPNNRLCANSCRRRGRRGGQCGGRRNRNCRCF